jgi:hypothetical protein
MKGRGSARLGVLGAALVIAAAIGAFSLSRPAASVVPDGAADSNSLFPVQVAALERSGLSAAEARREIEVQTAVAEANLVARLKVAMGEGFGGAWFEPAAAKLHIGVVSPQARQVAETIAEDAGLGPAVVETPVRWSWSELVAAQEVLNERVGDLLARGEAATSLAPRFNAVKLELGAAVPPARREALSGQAVAGVDPTVVRAGAAHFGIAPMARCGAFAEDTAFCDPSIVAGVTIREEKIGPPCTIGPAVIRKAFKEDTTETFMLTAGHCMSGLEDWYTSKKGVENLKKIGTGLAKFHKGAAEIDIGLIEVENAEWKDAGQVPVKPTIANWKKEETEPIPVVGLIEPVEKEVTCLSGQSSGTNCGVVTQVNLTLEGLKKLVEVREMTQTAKVGDSGGPWHVEGKTGWLAQGTMVGNRIIEEKLTEWSLFHPLSYSFEVLKELKNYDLQLLTTANETRPKCPMPGIRCFEAESYPATVTGSQIGASSFGFESGTVQCGSTTFSTTLGEGSETLEVPPSISSCSVGLVSVTADVDECKYKFAMTSKVEEDKYKGTVDVVCPSGKSIALTSACECTTTIGSQTALGTVEFVNTTSASPKKDVDIKLSVTGLKYRESSGCKNPGTRSNGTYSGELTVKADTEGGSAQGFWISG